VLEDAEAFAAERGHEVASELLYGEPAEAVATRSCSGARRNGCSSAPRCR
jgi:hypothetical protein